MLKIDKSNSEHDEHKDGDESNQQTLLSDKGIIDVDGSSQTLGIVQSHNWGWLTPWDCHLNNGRRSKTSSIIPVHLGAITEHLLPFLLLKEQLTISPSPKRYKEGMNITFNVPTDKEKNACTHTDMYI